MGVTASLSESSAVSIVPTICIHSNCPNRVALGKRLCTLHDMNPMAIPNRANTGRPKEEPSKNTQSDWCSVCCCCNFAQLMY